MSTITISLPNQIAKKIDQEAKKQGFATRSEFIRTLVRNHFSQEELIFRPFKPKPLEEVRLDLTRTGKYNQKFIDSVIEGLGRSSFYAR